MVNIGVVGLGYWGPNLLRNLATLADVNLSFLCDLDLKRAETLRDRFAPRAKATSNFCELADDSKITAVIIATPLRSHFEIGRFFLSAGKHIFLEKPLARTVQECQSLIDLAREKRRILMVGHVFEYNMAVQRIKQYLDQKELGKLFYVYSQRVNLGRIQNDVNALWSFAPHDISIMNYWLGEEPTRVADRGFWIRESDPAK